MAEHFDLLARVGDDDEAARRRGHQFLAQERAAAALYEREVGADLVRAVNGEVESLHIREGDERDAKATRLLFRSARCRHASNTKSLAHALAQTLDHPVRGRACAQSHGHPVLYELDRPRACPLLRVHRLRPPAAVAS